MKISIILLLKQSFKEKIDKNEIDKVQCGQLIQQFIIILVKYLHYIISCKNALFFRNIYLSEEGISIISEYLKIKCVI